jgi:hypothetical protein
VEKASEFYCAVNMIPKRDINMRYVINIPDRHIVTIDNVYHSNIVARRVSKSVLDGCHLRGSGR